MFVYEFVYVHRDRNRGGDSDRNMVCVYESTDR